MKVSPAWYWSIIYGLLAIVPTQTAAPAQAPPLPQPEAMTVDRSLSNADAAQMIKTARLFYAFWDTGNAAYASAAVDKIFVTIRCRKDALKVPKACFTLRRIFEVRYPTSIARSKT